jgi:hypothetical protein
MCSSMQNSPPRSTKLSHVKRLLRTLSQEAANRTGVADSIALVLCYGEATPLRD